MTRTVPSAAIVLICVALVTSVFGNIITVTNTNDSGPGSLRQALADANDGDTINFTVTGTIGLTSGELLVDKRVTISGPGVTNLEISSNASRIFEIASGENVRISGLMITGFGGFTLYGGAILNDHATLTLRNCAVAGLAAYGGGGIYNDGETGSAALTIVDSTVSGVAGGGAGGSGGAGGGIVNEGFQGSATLTIVNSAVMDSSSLAYLDDIGIAGGIYNQGGTVAISDGTISGNSASNWGGGIVNGGTLTITNSTVSGNQAGGFGDTNYPGIGGGIYGGGTIINSTISGNTAFGNEFKGPGFGGGIYGGGITIMNSTISGNSADIGGGISADSDVAIGNTVLNNNVGVNIDGTVTSQGYNISTDDGGGNLTGPGDQINTDPLLGPLQDNGGPTLTHALLPGSPAINAGDPNFTPPPLYDQRGAPFVRVFDGRLDTGSFEVQPTPTLTPTPTPRPPRASPTPRSRPTPPSRPMPR
jgi:hypothetical protein